MTKKLQLISLLICFLVGFFPANLYGQGRKEIELKVKAAYLLNFIRFTEWPESNGIDKSVTLCTLGEDPFGEILEDTFKDRDVSGKKLKIQRYKSSAKAAEQCDVIFISEDGAVDKGFMRSLSVLPVLTVSASNTVSIKASILKLVPEQDTIQFEINLKLAKKAGLKLSSRMIPLARKVYN